LRSCGIAGCHGGKAAVAYDRVPPHRFAVRGSGLRRGHRHAVLLVDEEGPTRIALERQLILRDVEVLCARHGRAALQMLSLGILPCLVLVDSGKPSVAGTELRRALLYTESYRHLPVQLFDSAAVRAPAALAEAMDEVRRTLAYGCAFLSVFHREATPRAPQLPAQRPPYLRGRRPER
jgi:CheY-like chemotaxis protein